MRVLVDGYLHEINRVIVVVQLALRHCVVPSQRSSLGARQPE